MMDIYIGWWWIPLVITVLAIWFVYDNRPHGIGYFSDRTYRDINSLIYLLYKLIGVIIVLIVWLIYAFSIV